MVNERKANFNFYLNQQGARGRKGEKGDQGFSPIVTEYESTATSYRLQIENLDGTFITPNLLPAIQDAGGTVLQFDREQQKYFLGDLPTATEDTPGLITTASENDLTNLSEIGAVSPIGVFTIASNVIEPGSDNVQIVVDGDANKIKIAVSQERFELPIATPTTLGGIKPDNQTIVVDPVTGETHANFDEIGNALNALSNKVNKIDEDVLTLDGLLIDTQGDVEVLQDKSTELDGRVSALEERELPEDVFTKENLKGGTNVTLRQVGNETYIDAVGGGQPVDAYTREETDELLEAKAFVADVYDKDETYNKGEVDDLIAGVTPKVDNVTIEVNTEGKLQTTVDINDVQNRVEDVEEKIADLQLYKFPNATIVGEPTINNGQVGNFTVNNYMQFPFILDLHNKPFKVRMCFTTGEDVTTQQNILDSNFSLALAIKDGRGLMAISSNGTGWNIGNVQGSIAIQPNTTYYAELSWNGILYKTAIGTNPDTLQTDMTLAGNFPPAQRTIYIGGCSTAVTGHEPHPFKGTINMNRCEMEVSGQIIWEGMDDVGLASRADIDLSNISEAGEQVIRDLAVGGNPLLAELPLVKATETKDSLAQGLNIENGQVVGNYHTCMPTSSSTFVFTNGASIEHGTTGDGEYLNHGSYIEVPLERNTIFYLPFVNNSQATDKGAGWTIMAGSKDTEGNFYPKVVSLWNIFSYVTTDVGSYSLLDNGNLQGYGNQYGTSTSSYVSDFKRQAFCVTSDNNLQMLNCSYSGQYRSSTADLRTAYLLNKLDGATHLRFVPFESNGIIGTDLVKKDTSGTDLQTMLNNGTMVYLEAENNAVPVHGEVIVTDKLSLKVDGTTVVVNEHGELSATAEPVPVATADTVGTVKPDNDTITIDEDGTLHAQGGGGGEGGLPVVASPLYYANNVSQSIVNAEYNITGATYQSNSGLYTTTASNTQPYKVTGSGFIKRSTGAWISRSYVDIPFNKETDIIFGRTRDTNYYPSCYLGYYDENGDFVPVITSRLAELASYTPIKRLQILDFDTDEVNQLQFKVVQDFNINTTVNYPTTTGLSNPIIYKISADSTNIEVLICNIGSYYGYYANVPVDANLVEKIEKINVARFTRGTTGTPSTNAEIYDTVRRLGENVTLADYFSTNPTLDNIKSLERIMPETKVKSKVLTSMDTSYKNVTDKPMINNVTVDGNMDISNFGFQEKITSIAPLSLNTIESNGMIGGTVNSDGTFSFINYCYGKKANNLNYIPGLIATGTGTNVRVYSGMIIPYNLGDTIKTPSCADNLVLGRLNSDGTVDVIARNYAWNRAMSTSTGYNYRQYAFKDITQVDSYTDYRAAVTGTTGYTTANTTSKYYSWDDTIIGNYTQWYLSANGNLNCSTVMNAYAHSSGSFIDKTCLTPTCYQTTMSQSQALIPFSEANVVIYLNTYTATSNGLYHIDNLKRVSLSGILGQDFGALEVNAEPNKIQFTEVIDRTRLELSYDDTLTVNEEGKLAVSALGGMKLSKLTNEEYTALGTKDVNTLYVVTSTNTVHIYLGEIQIT